jgi:L-ribulose-5-phosphate 4-epimerase
MELNIVRDELYLKRLIGAYDNGIGYGNISIRLKDNLFLVTGSATGNIEKLNEDHYTIVTKYSFEKNSLDCIGRINASSESLSHAAVYESNKNINAVIHVHNFTMWNHLLNIIPTTSPDVEYGTPEMAYEIKKLFENNPKNKIMKKNIFVMAGHSEGIICFGENLSVAKDTLIRYYNKINEYN